MNVGIVFDEADIGPLQVDYNVPLDTLEDIEISTALIELWAEIQDINRQLGDAQLSPGFRDASWRIRATRAKQWKLKAVDRLRAEAHRRGMSEVLPDYAAMIEAQRQFAEQRAKRAGEIAAEREARALPHALLMEQQAKEAERRRQARLELHAISTAANANRVKAGTEIFYAAARLCLSKEQMQSIWAKAEEMNPDHECFQQRPNSARGGAQTGA